MAWPPTLADLKTDLAVDDDRDDLVLTSCLNAAVQYVSEVRAGEFQFTVDPDSDLPLPGDRLHLGTVRLARRWYERRNSPDGLVAMQDLGSARVPTTDPDIARLLGIGPFRGPVFA